MPRQWLMMGTFWAINYFYPGDTKLLPGDDQIALTYGIGLTHQTAEQVERLWFKMQITDAGVVSGGHCAHLPRVGQ